MREATAQDIEGVRVLFREYAELVASAICFRSFERELIDLPGRYAPPGGALLVSVVEGKLAGCVALRQLDSVTGEMKRLYVRPGFQGLGLGRLLTEHIIGKALGIGYTTLRLDTLPKLHRAIGMYKRMGFCEIPPYGDNPSGAVCFEKTL